MKQLGTQLFVLLNHLYPLYNASNLIKSLFFLHSLYPLYNASNLIKFLFFSSFFKVSVEALCIADHHLRANRSALCVKPAPMMAVSAALPKNAETKMAVV